MYAVKNKSEPVPAIWRLPIAWWAGLGAAVLVFEVYVFYGWVSGPYFVPVSPGSSPVPEWMKLVLDIWQGAGLIAVLLVFYWFVFRPLRRDGHLSTDGLLVIAFATLWFQDPLSAYFGHWFTYNTHLVNFGSWVKNVPGWQSYGEPGAMIAEPILLIGPVYVYFIMIAILVGCALMRAVKRRWFHIANWKLLALCFLAMALVDLIGEGFIWLPLGFWEYPGGIPFLFNDTYHKYPLNEMLTIAAAFTALTALRYYKDDRGYTFAERGAESLPLGGKRLTIVRGLSIIGAVHVALFVLYNIPNTAIGAMEIGWPEDLTQRSYLTDNMCGAGTNNLCPGNGHGLIPKSPGSN